MLNPAAFIELCSKLNYSIYTGTPCSYMSSLFNHITGNKQLQYINVPNEGDAIGLATGAYLGGKKSIVMFQNSGLGNAINPLTSLSTVFQCPFIGLVSLRGDPDEDKLDEPQHQLMGSITTKILDTIGIPWQYLPDNFNQLEAAINLADRLSTEQKTPYFFVIKKNIFNGSDSLQLRNNSNITRIKAIELIIANLSPKDIILATTGKTGRELYTLQDKDNQFYMVGSMGCVLAIANGIALTNFKHKIFVLDGDGALLMRMGNMALTGQITANNIIHILLDNNCHDSTGGQSTQSEKIDFGKIASACGYNNIYSAVNTEQLLIALEQAKKNNSLSFIRVNIKPGSINNLARPNIHPKEVATRFKSFIEKNND